MAPLDLKPRVEFNVGSPMRQCRAVPFYEQGRPRGLVLAHSDFPNIDPYPPYVRWPTDSLKVSAFSLEGRRLWQKELGIMPGIWWCPVFPFDLDGDGADELYLVNSSEPERPLHANVLVLETYVPATGELRDARPWPRVNLNQSLSNVFRNFINAGYSHGRPRLITAQGTYGHWQMQCWDAQWNEVWTRTKTPDDPGCDGSHMFPVLDIDGDGRDELFYGERCMDIDTGKDLWIADAEAWRGHSDIVMPTLDRNTDRWLIYTCREKPEPPEARGVVMFDDHGRELWGHRNMQHVHMGWTARLCDDGTHRCYALEMTGGKTGVLGEHFYDIDGHPLEVPFPLQSTLPVDFDGDGLHELVYAGGERKGVVIDREGREMARLLGNPGIGPKSKFLDYPGEQIMTWDENGTIRIYGWPQAEDTAAARRRYEHPYYVACDRLWAVGYNWRNVGGL